MGVILANRNMTRRLERNGPDDTAPHAKLENCTNMYG